MTRDRVSLAGKQMCLPGTYKHSVAQAGGDSHLGLVLAILATIHTPAERIHWLRARLPMSASLMGVDAEV